jgi:hypothetical protein
MKLYPVPVDYIFSVVLYLVTAVRALDYWLAIK